MHAVLHQQGLRSPTTDLFGKRGRQWLQQVKQPEKARQTLQVCSRLIDSYTEEIEQQNRQLSVEARNDIRVRWLITIPGIGMYSAMLLLAEIGDIGRFANNQALCSYAGRWCRDCASRRAKRRGPGSRGKARPGCAG